MRRKAATSGGIGCKRNACAGVVTRQGDTQRNIAVRGGKYGVNSYLPNSVKNHYMDAVIPALLEAGYVE